MGWAARWARDLRLVALAMLLTLFGVAMIYSAGVTISPQRVVQGAWVRQLIWFVLALGAFTAVVRVPSRWFEWAATPAYVVTMVLLAITLVIGTGSGTAAGTRSSIALGPLRFQPAELAKLATILMIARHLANRSWGEASLKDVLVPAALAVLPLMLVLLQPDLGTAQAFIGVLFAMLFWAGFPLRILVLVASPGVALLLSFDTIVWSGYMFVVLVGLYVLRHRLFLHESAAVAIANLAAGTIARPLWNSLAEYQQNRLLVFLNPDIDPRGAGYHLIQSKIAIGNGGLWGRGFTEGSQKRYDFLPEQHTDFIFSVVGEELGFIGVMAVLVLFGLLLARLVRMAEDSDDPFAGLVLLGIFGAWFVHIVVNIGMTIGLVPITGIPLPFVSYGGTFLLMSWFAVAIAASAGRGEGGTRS
jgi:rod shape determining protein RodA